MAAVMSDSSGSSFHTVHRMGREDSRSTPTPSSVSRRSSHTHPRLPPSPQFQATETVPSQPAANILSHTDNPTPPASSTPTTQTPRVNHQNFSSSSTSQTSHPASNQPSSASTQQAPLISPALTNSPLQRSAWSTDDMANSTATIIKVRDLAHIQDFATEDFLASRNHGRRRGSAERATTYEISGMPITDVIEMVAGLLTKITTTNDIQHKALEEARTAQDTSAPKSHAVLAFHGKNVPCITIMSYLTRIHKYCPTTYEVFLSLLVYFDRMADRVKESSRVYPLRYAKHDDDVEMSSRPSTAHIEPGYVTPPEEEPSQLQTSYIPFVVDSFNIHRLVIAGVTCASKFFSDVFYTNSRYAKVGGLPLGELNFLEIQFLLINDFRLSIPVEELESYGTMLVEFYARSFIEQRIEKEKLGEAAGYEDDALMEAADSD